MTTTANIIPTSESDGLLYSNAVPLVSTEADLFGGTGAVSPDPIAVVEGQTIVASVVLAVQGHVGGQNTFVFLQTDLGDGNWIDVAWCFFTATDGSALFVLCGGGLGAMNDAFQQSRKQSAAPATQASGSNALPLGGRCRFTGFSTSVGGSSNLAGVTAGVQATIRYRLQTPR